MAFRSTAPPAGGERERPLVELDHLRRDAIDREVLEEPRSARLAHLSGLRRIFQQRRRWPPRALRGLRVRGAERVDSGRRAPRREGCLSRRSGPQAPWLRAGPRASPPIVRAGRRRRRRTGGRGRRTMSQEPDIRAHPLLSHEPRELTCRGALTPRDDETCGRRLPDHGWHRADRGHRDPSCARAWRHRARSVRLPRCRAMLANVGAAFLARRAQDLGIPSPRDHVDPSPGHPEPSSHVVGDVGGDRVETGHGLRRRGVGQLGETHLPPSQCRITQVFLVICGGGERGHDRCTGEHERPGDRKGLPRTASYGRDREPCRGSVCRAVVRPRSAPRRRAERRVEHRLNVARRGDPAAPVGRRRRERVRRP